MTTAGTGDSAANRLPSPRDEENISLISKSTHGQRISPLSKMRSPQPGLNPRLSSPQSSAMAARPPRRTHQLDQPHTRTTGIHAYSTSVAVPYSLLDGASSSLTCALRRVAADTAVSTASPDGP